MSQSGIPGSRSGPLAFLAGGGEMGQRTRVFDWSTSPVGPISTWPESLKTAVSVCLGSRYPIVIWWGRDALTQFYNDAYIPVLGVTKHPGWLGRSGRECWSDIWPIMGPMWQGVFATGQATWSEDFLYVIARNLPREEGYFTFSYSPLRDDTGAVGGIFCACNETTGRVIGERRLRTLRDLGQKVTVATSAEEACGLAARTLADNPHDIPFALVYLLEGEARGARLEGEARGARAQYARLVATTGLEVGGRAAPERIDLREPAERAASWPLRRTFDTTLSELVSDVTARFGPLPGGPWPESPEAALISPIAAPGQARPIGFLVAGLSPRRVVDADYRSFFDLIAGHIGTAVANARAYEEERRRAEALAELDRAKTVFFSNVSHEFRTPLTLMLGPVEDLLVRKGTDLPPDAANQLEIVNRNGLRLLRLVNTLLDFSRIEAGRGRAVYQPTDLAAFTAELAGVFRAAIEKAGLRLLVDCPKLAEPVFVDREMWEKIVLNLLSNAFKFTFDGEIAVALRQADDVAELRIRDTGAGIPAEEMPRLFERFHRVENATGRTHEGSGIGLALVQELVRLHGGSIAADSIVGDGTTFTVRVPLGSAHLPPDRIGQGRDLRSAATAAAPYVEEALRWLPDAKQTGDSQIGVPEYEQLPVVHPSTAHNGSRPRVLIAEDNADMRQYLVRLLADQYDVRAVADGKAALAAAQLRPADLILTDVMMPRLDGFGLLKKLRADPRTSGLPVIMLSARAGEESRVEGLEAKADDYLVKPFSARELLARVSAHLQMARLRREANESLRQGEERLRMALTAARMVAWQLDPATGNVIVSDNAVEVFGLPPGVTLAHSDQAFALIHPDDVSRHRATVGKAVEECGSYLSEFRMIRPANQAVIWLEERGHAARDHRGATARLVGVVMDITDRKAAEAALRESDHRKDEFLATLAHELRNPLAPIRNAAQLLRMNTSQDPQAQQLHNIIQRQVNHMVRLVDDLLDVSRISRGKIQLQRVPVRLADVIQNAVETSEPLIQANRHQISLSLPPEPLVVRGDMVRLTQVVANLLNNAAKYTPEGGRIFVALAAEGGQALIRVRDTGLGVPADMLDKVFELFTQINRNLKRAQGGLGIGLSLVKRLVRMHGGTIEAFSEGEGHGAEFVVRLPLAEPDSARLETGAKPAQAALRAPLRILVIDDNVDAASSLGMLLSSVGHEVRTANDGPAGIIQAASLGPNLVLLDLGMAGMDGYETLRSLRALPRGHESAVVALTGWGQEEDRRRTSAAGFDFHLVKPVDLAALEEVLANVRS